MSRKTVHEVPILRNLSIFTSRCTRVLALSICEDPSRDDSHYPITISISIMETLVLVGCSFISIPLSDQFDES